MKVILPKHREFLIKFEVQTGGTLADDEHGQCPGQRRQCLAQGGVGGVVQRAGAVIQNQNVRLAHQRTGDGEPLLLSAGSFRFVLPGIPPGIISR